MYYFSYFNVTLIYMSQVSWIGLLFNLGLILALLAILYYFEYRIRDHNMQINKLYEINHFSTGIIHDLTVRYNTLDNQLNGNIRMHLGGGGSGEGFMPPEPTEDYLLPLGSSPLIEVSDNSGTEDSYSDEEYTEDEDDMESETTLDDDESELNLDGGELDALDGLNTGELELEGSVDDNMQTDNFDEIDQSLDITTAAQPQQTETAAQMNRADAVKNIEIILPNTLDYKKMSLKELKTLAKEKNVGDVSKLTKGELVKLLQQTHE